jgi:hypothetical protein
MRALFPSLSRVAISAKSNGGVVEIGNCKGTSFLPVAKRRDYTNQEKAVSRHLAGISSLPPQ